MELRRDPITQAWVIIEDRSGGDVRFSTCPLCPGQESASPRTIYEYPYGHPQWQVRVIPHPRPIYRIEGEPERRAEGIYDKMRNLGAHEAVIEHPSHTLRLTQMSDEHIAQVVRAFVWRLTDLKKDQRFRYVALFRNQGAAAGQELEHPHSLILATPFIPRRTAYELRSSLEYFHLKERCLICDMLNQELVQQVRTVEWTDSFVAFCPFASRVPYETWILPRDHHCSFEEDLVCWDRQLRFARFLKSVLRRIESITTSYHLALHTSPNVNAKFDKPGRWQTLVDDFHWHIEVLPAGPPRGKSYSAIEVYYNRLAPELAAEQLRTAPLELEHKQ